MLWDGGGGPSDEVSTLKEETREGKQASEQWHKDKQEARIKGHDYSFLYKHG